MTRSEEDFPFKTVGPDELLHPYNMGPELAALIMRSLRWLGDPDEGGRHIDLPRAARYREIAQAFEDYLSVNHGLEFGVAAHPSSISSLSKDQDRLMEITKDALERMKELFEFNVYQSLWI